MTSSVVYRQKHALIIGINNYLLNPLEYCINDAEDLEKILQRIDFHVLLGIDCNLYKFYSIIDIFTNRIQQDDLILFYFAGHGKQMKDDDYLLPVDYYLLPVDYYYDYRGNEQDYIIKHAINVKHMIRTRSLNSNHNLLFMNGSSQTLIVFACAPGNAVQDETRNNRNGSFMENLLKHITIPNKDIEEIMKQVADDVNKQTDGFQLLHRISSWLGKVFLVQNKNQGFLPYIRTSIRFAFNNQVPPDRSVPFQQTEDLSNFKIFDKSFDQCPTLVNHYNKVSKTPRPNPSFNISITQSNENYSWCPSYFIEPEQRELMAKQLAMEAQFFLELRKYLFPPAILALKHAIIGSIFWFEKSLLMDGLIQLLIYLRDPNTGFVEEIFDFIPLLIC
ncbi:unnamed protein product [Rotaria sordida]|uniref:Peptidase C14 caspase domain-containing protein n=2 Tax=Rotaria sordida TaxID=392033 RepID=A0A818YJE2_9BILA|nr:unnamed protein product [Rotaria sordida]CAF3750773.1 unnamed protein product [Rotaria sordida]